MVSGADVRLMQMSSSNNTADKVVNLVPELIDKISSMIPKKKEDKGQSDTSN